MKKTKELIKQLLKRCKRRSIYQEELNEKAQKEIEVMEWSMEDIFKDLERKVLFGESTIKNPVGLLNNNKQVKGGN